MAGTAAAVASGDQLVQEVVGLAHSLGLHAHTQFKMGRRIWGAERRIDVILTNPKDGWRLRSRMQISRRSRLRGGKNPGYHTRHRGVAHRRNCLLLR